MRVNAIQVLQENYFCSEDKDNMSFYEYVRRESEDPTFWGWLFNREDCDTFDHLSIEEKEEYHSFMEEVKLFSLKMDYIVVRHIYGDDDPMFSVTRRNNFSVMPYHDTYDHNGGFDYSCDYTVEENDHCFRSLKKAVYDKFRLVVEREGNSGLIYADPNTLLEVKPNEEIALFVHQWREENENIPMVTAWNYYDGHNWRSIIIDYGDIDAEPFYEEVVGEIADDILSQFNGSANDCINGMYETEGFVFKSSRSQSDPWIVHADSHKILNINNKINILKKVDMKTIMVKPDNNSGIFRLVNEVECDLYRINGGKTLVKVERYNDTTRCVSPATSFSPNKYEEAHLVMDNDVKVENRWVKDIQAEHLVSKKKVVRLKSSYYNAETLREEILVPRNYIKLPDGKFLLNRVNKKDFVSLLIVNTVPGFSMTCIKPCQVNADGGEWAVLFGDFYESTDGKKCFSVKGEADSKHFLIVHESKDYQEGTVLDLSENALFHQRVSVSGAFKYFYVLKSDTAPGDIIAKRAEKLVKQK